MRGPFVAGAGAPVGAPRVLRIRGHWTIRALPTCFVQRSEPLHL